MDWNNPEIINLRINEGEIKIALNMLGEDVLEVSNVNE